MHYTEAYPDRTKMVQELKALNDTATNIVLEKYEFHLARVVALLDRGAMLPGNKRRTELNLMVAAKDAMVFTLLAIWREMCNE